MRLSDALRAAASALAPCTDSPSFEARAMAARILGVGIPELVTVTEAEGALPSRMGEMVSRRLSGEPLQYILGEWEFMGLPMLTDSRALIPRQDTETLVELALQKKGGTALDMCCGTGCIGVSLAKLGGYEVTFSDISAGCIALARENAALNGVEGVFVTGDLFENIEGGFDLICCNPPYIPTGELSTLQAEVQREPRLALDGGADGLDFYRRLSREYPQHLGAGGWLLMEVGAGQAERVASMFDSATVHRDLNGVERVVEVRKIIPKMG